MILLSVRFRSIGLQTPIQNAKPSKKQKQAVMQKQAVQVEPQPEQPKITEPEKVAAPVVRETPAKVTSLDSSSENKGRTNKVETAAQQQQHSNDQDAKGIRVKVGESILESGERGGANLWQPTNTNEALNPNIAIVGTMGTGKTQTVKSMLTQIAQQRHLNPDGESIGALIFDYKSDYIDDEFINATGATILEPYNLPINPFILHSKERRALINTTKIFCSTLTKVYGLGVKQTDNLKNCILAAYEMKGIVREDTDTFTRPAPTLHDVIKIFNNQEKIPEDKLYAALSDLYDFEVFETNNRKCKSLYDAIDGEIVVVKLGELDSSIQNLIVAVLLDQFFTQMHSNPKPTPTEQYRALKKLILVDEADNFLSQDFPSLRKILKEGREFGVGVALSTQGLDHFDTKENNYRDYVTHWICHRLVDPKAKDVQPLVNTKTRGETESVLSQLRELEKHHSLYINGKKEVVYQESTAFWKLAK